MKLKITLLSALAVAFMTVAFVFAKHINPAKAQTHKPSSEGMEDDEESRMGWEIKRLADPATGKIPANIRQLELAFAATLPKAEDWGINRSNPAVFINRGPYNVGGKTGAFGMDVTNENRLLAGTHSGGMFLSTDAGATWNMTNTASQLKGANCLAQDKRPGHTSNWYYGGGNPWASAGGGGGAYYLGDGIYKSTDNGVTWMPLSSTTYPNVNTFTGSWQVVYSLAVDQSAPSNADEVYVAMYGGVYRTTNGFATNAWTTCKAGGSYFTEVAVTTTGVVYCTLDSTGSSKGIWRSTDGITFTQIMPAAFDHSYNRIVIGINPNNEDEVYFMGNTPGYGKLTIDFLGNKHYNSLWKYNYVSGNGSGAGGTWQDLSANLPATGGVFDKFQTQESYDMVVKVKPGNSSVVFIGGTNLYRSTSAFQDSTHTSYIGGYEQGGHLPVINSYLNHHPDQHCLEFSPSNPNIMYNSNDGGVFKTMNNTDSVVAWQSLDNGYVTSMFYTVAIDHGTPNNNVIVGGAQDNGSWFTNNNTVTSPWLHVHGGDGSYCAVADGRTSYYFSIQNGMRLVKANLDASGNTLNFARVDPIGGKGYQWMNPFVLDPNNNNIMYMAGGKFLWRNSDLSAIPMANTWDSITTNWTRFNDSLPNSDSTMTALTVCKTPANRVYYGTGSKRVFKVDNANVGTPAAVEITSSLFPAGGYVSNIAVDPNDGNKLFVIFSNYNIYSIFYSTDGGLTFTKQGGNLETTISANNPSIRWASILHVADGTVYLMATSVGLFATDTLMGTNTVWVQQGISTIGNSVCDMIETRQSDGLVVIATHANGMYSTNITSVGDVAASVKDIAAFNSEFGLTSYPNPFVQSATIEFTLNKKSKVTLQIWDEYGRIVETLAEGQLPEGKHSFVFDRKNLSPGIYYYSLTADNRRKTNKMVIVK